MYAASFDYHRPSTVDEAIALLTKHGDDVAPGLKRRHESQLVLRRDAAERGHIQQPAAQRFV